MGYLASIPRLVMMEVSGGWKGDLVGGTPGLYTYTRYDGGKWWVEGGSSWWDI